MTRYDKYLIYVLKHKWFVMIECFKVGLYWRGIAHDFDKFLPSLFIPYARRFFGPGKDIKSGRDKTGYYDPTKGADEKFKAAVQKHLLKNKHHWQYWNVDAQPMPLKYVKEMVCDWKGAGRAQGNTNYSPLKWFEANKKTMIIHKHTEALIKKVLQQEEAK